FQKCHPVFGHCRGYLLKVFVVICFQETTQWPAFSTPGIYTTYGDSTGDNGEDPNLKSWESVLLILIMGRDVPGLLVRCAGESSRGLLLENWQVA
ncbi:hypothetical protein ABFB09_04835, partial [Dehalogenimonas sp. THU2]|uniref:hypothetical protein n=1 Tax=Dehalogenimonas sp. THU2 TaxID=3151121 RepID=UPI0032184EDD